MMKDIVYSLSTEEGLKQFTTEKIKGKLVAVIVNSDEKLELNIDSELGYSILESADASERVYYNITERKVDRNGHGLQDGSCFYLNEKLTIYINGKQNSEIKIILRIE